MAERTSAEERLIQLEYIEKLRSFYESRIAAGNAPSYHIETLGCQMNVKDSEKLAGILRDAGFVFAASEEDADLVLYNTCTVRENANQRMYGRLGRLQYLKKQRPEMLIAVCGCMMQEPDEVACIREKYGFVDIVFGTHNVFRLAELLYRRLTEEKQVIEVWEGTEEIVEDLPAVRKYPFKAGVNIMFGCNNFCSYCIVPYVRGRERSRESREILHEVEKLAGEGVKEIMLLGQNVNSYGHTLEEGISFAELLRMCAAVPGIERIRFMTSHPKDLSDELIAVMGEDRKICDHFPLPLQSGSDRILKAMNRRYTREQYLTLVEKLRKAVPGISVTTDIIVGFPGETEEDFQDTMDMVRRVRYDSVFTFIYSKRTGTPAARLPDQVPEDVVKDRFDRLLRLVQETAAEALDRNVGRVFPVLAEEKNRREEGMLTGRLTNNLTVHFRGGEELIGQIIPVQITENCGFYYLGETEGR